jgi:hypothetical protein
MRGRQHLTPSVVPTCRRPRRQVFIRHDVRAIVDRTATRRVLERLGFLFVAGGPIRPPLNFRFGQKIT